MITNEIVLATNVDLLVAATPVACLGIILCNVSPDTEEKITIYAVKSGDTAGAKNTVLKNKVIGPEKEFNFNFKLLLNTGDKVVVVGSAGSLVSATIDYTA